MLTPELTELIPRCVLVAFAIYLVYRLEIKAMEKGINGKLLATAIGVILALALAGLGVVIQDVFFH